MKLYLHDNGDDSVGIFSQGYCVDVPFERDDVDFDTLADFKKDIVKIYSDFCDGRLKALYDFELDSLQDEQLSDDE